MNLKELLDDHQLYHSRFQQDYLITVKSGGTLYGQYKQSLRELYKRFRGLREISCDRKKIEVEIKQLKHQTETKTDKFETELDQIELERKIMQQEEGERIYSETKREFTRFYQQSLILKEKLGELSAERRDQLDRDMWEYKLKEMIALDFVSSGRLSKSTYELINAAPKLIRNSLLEMIKSEKSRSGLIDWYENKEDHEDIDYDKLPELSYNEDDILKITN